MESLSRSRCPSLVEDCGARPNRVGPTQHLLVAIVRRAVWDFVLYRDNPHPCKRSCAEDAAGWLFWDGQEECDVQGRYTFLHICALLGLDAAQIRNKALTLKRSDLQRLNTRMKVE